MTVGGQTMPTETTIGKTTLRLVVGDIAEQDTDAVVTAAHWRLNKEWAWARMVWRCQTKAALAEYMRNRI